MGKRGQLAWALRPAPEAPPPPPKTRRRALAIAAELGATSVSFRDPDGGWAGTAYRPGRCADCGLTRYYRSDVTFPANFGGRWRDGGWYRSHERRDGWAECQRHDGECYAKTQLGVFALCQFLRLWCNSKGVIDDARRPKGPRNP